MTTPNNVGSAFKVGDRVEVIEAEGCEEWYSAGSTGTIKRVGPSGYWIDFDPPFGKPRPSGSRDWFACGERLRPMTAALSNIEGASHG